MREVTEYHCHACERFWMEDGNTLSDEDKPCPYCGEDYNSGKVVRSGSMREIGGGEQYREPLRRRPSIAEPERCGCGAVLGHTYTASNPKQELRCGENCCCSACAAAKDAKIERLREARYDAQTKAAALRKQLDEARRERDEIVAVVKEHLYDCTLVAAVKELKMQRDAARRVTEKDEATVTRLREALVKVRARCVDNGLQPPSETLAIIDAALREGGEDADR